MISLDDALDDKKNGVFILRDVQCLVTFSNGKWQGKLITKYYWIWCLLGLKILN